MNFGSECSGRSWLIVVFEEPGQLVLVIEACVEVLTDRPGMTLAEAVVESFVVSVVEALLLQRPFQVPVDLGHEAEIRDPLSNLLGRARPERLRAAAPGAFENIRQDKHGHIAAHTVTLTGDPQQFSDHCLLRRCVAVVKLQRIRPARKVGIAPVGQN